MLLRRLNITKITILTENNNELIWKVEAACYTIYSIKMICFVKLLICNLFCI